MVAPGALGGRAHGAVASAPLAAAAAAAAGADISTTKSYLVSCDYITKGGPTHTHTHTHARTHTHTHTRSQVFQE